MRQERPELAGRPRGRGRARAPAVGTAATPGLVGRDEGPVAQRRPCAATRAGQRETSQRPTTSRVHVAPFWDSSHVRSRYSSPLSVSLHPASLQRPDLVGQRDLVGIVGRHQHGALMPGDHPAEPLLAAGSRFAVGSSSSRIGGLPSRARPSAMRCRCPTERLRPPSITQVGRGRPGSSASRPSRPVGVDDALQLGRVGVRPAVGEVATDRAAHQGQVRADHPILRKVERGVVAASGWPSTRTSPLVGLRRAGRSALEQRRLPGAVASGHGDQLTGLGASASHRPAPRPR